MKPTLLAMTAIAALAISAPAAGQSRYDADTRFDLRIEQLESRIDAGARAGTIDRREAWRMRRQLRQIDQLEDRYARGGFTLAERRDLQQRIRGLRQEVRVADRGAWDRNERYGYWDEDNRDPYGRYTGRGGPDEGVVCVERDRGGIAGFIDNLTGRDDVCYGVGQRFSGGLYGVPDAYRTRYRDRADVYFRSDGRNIFTIDARTNVILDIDPM